jgi:uncharacterized cupin superfamily protein
MAANLRLAEVSALLAAGKAALITNAGEQVLRAGDCAAFRRGDPDGHHLVNNSGQAAKVLKIGDSDAQDRRVYPYIDIIAEPAVEGYSHRDGAPYPVAA